MKFLSPFLAFIVLFLSLVPCSDELTMNNKGERQIHSEHKHNGDQKEECTPFCCCSCCSNNIVFNPETIKINLMPECPEHNLFFYQDSKSFFIHAIWQPPKNKV